MRLGRIAAILVCTLAGSVPLVASTRTHRGLTSHKTSSKASLKRTSAKTRVIGQRGIDDDRATELQQALIHAGYMTGDPSGHWDNTTEAAMTKLQADNGWQTKLVPDSRAIIKLGLGPAAGQSEQTPSSANQEAGSAGSSGNGLLAAR